MRRTAAQRAAIAHKARRYATSKFIAGDAERTYHHIAATAYAAGFKAGEGKAVAAPAAALLHVLDTQVVLKAKIEQLRAALRMLGNQAIQEAAK